MRKSLQIGVILLGVHLCSVLLLAQASVGTPPVALTDTTVQEGQPVQGAEQEQQTSSDQEEQTDARPRGAPDVDAVEYVPALDGTGLILVNHSVRSRFLLGANYSGGYDTNPNAVPNAPKAGAFLLSPLIGIQANTAKTFYLVQYQPTFRDYTTNKYEGGSIHAASGDVAGSLSERWRWDGHAKLSYGQDSIRMLAPQQSVAIGDVPGAGLNAAANRPDAGTTTAINGRANLTYLASERDTVGLLLENSYSNYTAVSGTDLVGAASAEYTHALTPHFKWLAYGSSDRYYGFIHCYAFGGGVGIDWRPEEHTYLHLSGGPQLNASACGKQQSFAYNAAYSHRMTTRSQLYLTSARQVGSTFVGPSLWRTSAAAGYQYDFGRKESIQVDFGYIGTTGLRSADAYSGKYVDAVYNRSLGYSLSTSLSYRWYAGDLSTSSFNRTTALLSLAWTPTAGHLLQ
jgi:hypothetical protein